MDVQREQLAFLGRHELVTLTRCHAGLLVLFRRYPNDRLLILVNELGLVVMDSSGRTRTGRFHSVDAVIA